MIYDISDDLRNPIVAMEYLVKLSQGRSKDIEEGEITWLAEALITLFKIDPYVYTMQQIEINGQTLNVKPTVARIILDMQEKIKVLEGKLDVIKYLNTNR